MLLTIAVDANPMLAALLGGYARTVLFDPRFSFVTADYTMMEVRQYLPMVSEKSSVPVSELEKAIRLLPVKIFQRAFYRFSMPEARRRMEHIDPDDVDILALALHLEVPLWSNDLHFTKVHPPIKLLQTKDFIL